jgi:hypothetical protein
LWRYYNIKFAIFGGKLSALDASVRYLVVKHVRTAS